MKKKPFNYLFGKSGLQQEEVEHWAEPQTQTQTDDVTEQSVCMLCYTVRFLQACGLVWGHGCTS